MTIPPKILKYITKEGILLFNNKRATVVDNDIFHMLFCELLYSLGGELGQEIFYRFGYSEGYSDGIHIRDIDNDKSGKKNLWFDSCIDLMSYRGFGEISINSKHIDEENGLFDVEVSVKNAFESDQYRLRLENTLEEAAPFLQGYLAGFCSLYMNKEIYFSEPTFQLQGSGRYTLTGKPESQWDQDIQKKIHATQAHYDKKFTLNEMISNMRKSEMKFRDLYEQAPFMYCSINRSGMITECNQAGCQLLGFSLHELMGLHIKEIFINFDEDKFWSICESQSGLKGLEGVFLRKDKTEIFISMDATAQFDYSGSVSGIRCIIIDISDRKSLETRLKEKNTMLDKMSKTDALTMLYNRRYLMEIFESEFEKADRYGYPLSMIILDLDRFKQINDYFGHNVGDKVLCVISDLIVRNVRKGDIVARFGGEEFTIIAPCTDLGGAYELAEKIRSIIQTESSLEIEEDVIINVTASFGVASYYKNNYLGFDDFLQAADDALFKSKRSGRNKVTTSESNSFRRT
ncbi:MAG: diguanylate cyclase [Candidatus Auribacterota bacterium]|jgi:diguanylate cyclase (GGDEF)-like protein/PAS domain S-box-containing protein|nr:diguanylate cyclase [Candidatus Auribacterota bacterium]